MTIALVLKVKKKKNSDNIMQIMIISVWQESGEILISVKKSHLNVFDIYLTFLFLEHLSHSISKALVSSF
jgi:hypothetical protein